MSGNIQMLYSQTLRRLDLKAQIKDLESQIEPLEKELFQLYITAHNEQADVDNLESSGIKNWFLGVTGKKEAMIDKERREAQAARLQHDTAKRRLDWMREQLADSRRELKGLSGCDRAYRDALEAMGDTAAMAAHLENVRREVEAAAVTANVAIADTNKILSNIMTLLERNRYGSGTVNMMMPSYLASEQKRINLLRRKMELLVEEVSSLPVDEPILESETVLMDIDAHLLEELMSTAGRYSALAQAEMSLRSTLKALDQVRSALADTGEKIEDQLISINQRV